MTGSEQEVGLDISETLHDQIAPSARRADRHRYRGGRSRGGQHFPAPLQSHAPTQPRVAERVDADVVVFGTMDMSQGLTDIAAEFYVSDRGLTGAEELSGVYPLDSVRLATTDPVAVRRRTSEVLEPKMVALAQLVVGLSHYQLNEYVEAEALFRDAFASWPGSAGGTNGLEAMLSLLGNDTGLQDDLDAAELFYSQALDLDPDYGRALFGAAEVVFQRSKGSRCAGSGEADVAGLKDAVRRFEEIIDLPGPPLAFLPERARVEIGRIYMCLSSNGVDHREEAREILEGVIADISGETRLIDLADTHFSLGVNHLLTNDQAAAIAEFETAVEITLNDIRKRGFYRSLSFIYLCQLKQPNRADAYFREAEALPGPPLEPIRCTAQS